MGAARAARPRCRGARRPGAIRAHRARGRRPAPVAGWRFPCASSAAHSPTTPARSPPASRTRCWPLIRSPASGASSTTATCGSKPTTARSSRSARTREPPSASAATSGGTTSTSSTSAGTRCGDTWSRRSSSPGRSTRSRRSSPGASAARSGRACASPSPHDVPAHSREQSYYFGPDGLIRRNDYTAEVFGGWAKAAHYCWDYRDFGGFKVPTRRVGDAARARGGRPRASDQDREDRDRRRARRVIPALRRYLYV